MKPKAWHVVRSESGDGSFLLHGPQKHLNIAFERKKPFHWCRGCVLMKSTKSEAIAKQSTTWEPSITLALFWFSLNQPNVAYSYILFSEFPASSIEAQPLITSGDRVWWGGGRFSTPLVFCCFLINLLSYSFLLDWNATCLWYFKK